MRNECLLAVCEAFDGADVQASSGLWNFSIATTPKRELAMSPGFVAANIQNPNLTQAALTDHIKSIAKNDWVKNADGSFSTILI